MSDLLILPNVTEGFIHGDDKCPEISSYLNKHKSSFEYSLIPDLSYLNHRAECHTGIDIDHISYISKNEYQIDYSYDWNIYNGCDGLNDSGTENECVIFTISKSGEIEFETEHFEARSTHDEI